MELLVVIALVALLIALLLPALSGARRAAMDVKCRSNMRQVCAALIHYSIDYKGKFPPFIQALSPLPPAPQRPWNWWSDGDRIGRYLSNPRVTRVGYAPGSVIRSVLACPADEGASRSYSMNYWASSAVNTHAQGQPAQIGIRTSPTSGLHWGPKTKGSSKLILLGEALSAIPDEGGYVASPIMGAGSAAAVPGSTWNAGPQFFASGISWPGFIIGFGFPRFTSADCEFDWARHRQQAHRQLRYTQARGRSNFGFADGHVTSYSVDDLVHRRTGKSNLVAWWTPVDDKRP